MKIRVYHPRMGEDDGALPVHASLGGARAVATAIASQRGEPVEVWRYMIEGPDTEVVVALLNVFGPSAEPLAMHERTAHEGFWTPKLHEVHKPTEQIVLPGDGPIPWAVVVEKVDEEEGEPDDE